MINHEHLARLTGSAVDAKLGSRLDRIVELLERIAPPEFVAPPEPVAEPDPTLNETVYRVGASQMTVAEMQAIVTAALYLVRTLHDVAGRTGPDVFYRLRQADDRGQAAQVSPGAMIALVERLQAAGVPGWWQSR